jgi:hypothetical protein
VSEFVHCVWKHELITFGIWPVVASQQDEVVLSLSPKELNCWLQTAIKKILWVIGFYYFCLLALRTKALKDIVF